MGGSSASPASSSERLAQIHGQLSDQSPRDKEIQDVYILSAARTPTGKFMGALSTVSAPNLGAVAIRAAVSKSNVPPHKITGVYFGNVLQAGVGQAPARQATLLAGLSSSTESITVNKVCSSGLKAVVLAAQSIQLGLAEAQVAGGMESMSSVPYYHPRASQMPKYGDVKIQDGLVEDGLLDKYNQIHMGVCAEKAAEKYGISREDQDAYAIRSFERAQAAWKAGKFEDEIAPVTVSNKGGNMVVTEDEGYNNLKKDKVPTLKSAFVPGGSVTAANSSLMSDGASAVVLGSKAIAQMFGRGSRVLARIVSSADAALDPVEYPVAPAKAILLALERAQLQVSDIAIWEINEAFAAVVKANEQVSPVYTIHNPRLLRMMLRPVPHQILGLQDAKLNVLGGAIALGHALGSSGARILTTLLHQLRIGDYGLAALCNGGGGATAIIVHRVDSV
ncbi:uncharacterized protein Z520_04995 [Fonsecaea multimorphosa CBS 102226]|uniref:acetyl-CoA C-acetyltransferase n=1 Tax=Fonsecaea multimorphosa CBS 102226 TaxID=1442371 RepID=A0A0D2K8H0_9EURO|nr:uncharacterized protein Z520_04995 [Fonsecaea multimorphosa CBS 102226]KIX99419.1 hypothetical protein Z520_04995 [Fonsecaea multimorphosa CBS 102226]OAL25747.1 hypothetical protein AYO22_04736 [Fonsecaea multimorphosa]